MQQVNKSVLNNYFKLGSNSQHYAEIWENKNTNRQRHVETPLAGHTYIIIGQQDYIWKVVYCFMLYRLKRLLPSLLWLWVKSDCMLLSTCSSSQIGLKGFGCSFVLSTLVLWSTLLISLSGKSSFGLIISVLVLSNSSFCSAFYEYSIEETGELQNSNLLSWCYHH